AIRELRFLVLRHEPEPSQAFALALLRRGEFTVELRQVGEHGQGTMRLLAALRTHADLLEVRVVDPDALAVGDDRLLVRRGRFPAELPRRLERERAVARLACAAVRAAHGLLEFAGKCVQSVRECIETRARSIRTCGMRRGAEEQKREQSILHGRTDPWGSRNHVPSMPATRRMT